MNLKKTISNTLNDLIIASTTDEKIKEIKKRHDKKPHFIPIKFRILYGLLCGMNIKYGNFIEDLMSNIIVNDPNLDIISYKSKKNNFEISEENEIAINNYISTCERGKGLFDIKTEFPKLMQQIVNHRNDTPSFKINHDIDLLFEDKNTNKKYYVEIKYNDDHDSNKFPAINQKFIKTYAYLVKELDVKAVDELTPIIFYFTNIIKVYNYFVPEGQNIYRGENFFNTFLSITYEDVENALLSFSEDKKTLKKFTDLYNKIMNLKI